MQGNGPQAQTHAPNHGCEGAASPSAAGQLVEILNKCLNAVLVHRDGRLLYANDAYARMHGYASPAEAIANHIIGMSLHPDDRDLIASRIRARLAGEEDSAHYEFRLVRKDGEVVWMDCLASRITWNGEPALLGIYHDVTARKRAEEALQQSQRLFSTVFMSSPDVMVLSRLEDGTILDVNEAFLRLRNRRREDVIGRTGPELGLWDGPDRRAAIVGRLQRSERVTDLQHQIRQPDGRVRHMLGSAELLEVNGEKLILYVSRDVTEQRRAESRIVHIAHHDPLTGLANRALFQTQLQLAFEQGQPAALLCLDLNRFKEVNDSYGHPVGDALLCQVAARLRGTIRAGDVVARLGGDEFAIILFGEDLPSTAQRTANRVVERVGQPFDVGGRLIAIAASVGFAIGMSDAATPADLLRAADLALYRAKAAGEGCVIAFHPRIAEQEEARGRLELELRRAVVNGEFALHYQPLIDLRCRRLVGFEALIRWNHPERGWISPDDFIRPAEEMGLIVPIGDWVLRQACQEAAGWPDDCKVAVNISAAQLRSRDLLGSVRSALAQSGLPARRLELEVTESVVIHDTEEALAAMRHLKDMGVSLALDDFGTGYSSMGALVRFPFDRVKIDRSFVSGLGQRQDCSAIVRAVTSLCSSLGVAITAEGVETPEQLAMLGDEGCGEVQGFLLGRPVSASELRFHTDTALLRAEEIAA